MSIVLSPFPRLGNWGRVEWANSLITSNKWLSQDPDAGRLAAEPQSCPPRSKCSCVPSCTRRNPSPALVHTALRNSFKLGTLISRWVFSEFSPTCSEGYGLYGRNAGVITVLPSWVPAGASPEPYKCFGLKFLRIEEIYSCFKVSPTCALIFVVRSVFPGISSLIVFLLIQTAFSYRLLIDMKLLIWNKDISILMLFLIN